MKEIFDKIVCIGCGWVGGIDELSEHGACPVCEYECGGTPPWRLQTLREMLESKEETGFVNVRLDLFLRAFSRLLGLELDEEQTT